MNFLIQELESIPDGYKSPEPVKAPIEQMIDKDDNLRRMFEETIKELEGNDFPDEGQNPQNFDAGVKVGMKLMKDYIDGGKEKK